MAKVLPTTEKDLIARLLRVQADEFFRGSELLYEAQGYAGGDSAYFLRLMAIELYFKLIYLLETESLIFGHELREIFDLLPRGPRQSVFHGFNQRVTADLQLDEFREWLKYLGGLFMQIRYPFEEFREMPIEDYEAKLKRFEQAAHDDFSDASIVYHIDRVNSLVGALRAQAAT
jgi:hypothetical protein